MDFGERIKQLRMANGLTLEQVGDAVGVGKSTVRKWETGQIANMRRDKIAKLASALHTTPGYLMGWEPKNGTAAPDSPLSAIGERYIPKAQIPLLGRVAAGLPLYAEENIEGYIASDFDDGEIYYGLRVQGDSMSAAGIDDGDVVIVRQQDSVDTDQIAVVMVNGNDATIKYVQQQGDIVFLSPKSYNPLHQIQIYDLAKTPVRILGRVVQVRKSV